MPETNFRFGARLRDFWTNITSREVKKTESLIFFLLWLISFILINSNIRLPYNQHDLFHIVHIYLWFKVVGDILKKYRPPCEILIACFFLFFLFEIPVLNSVYASSSFFSSTISTPASPLKFLQILIQASFILTFSLILVQNTRGKRGTLVGFFFLALICSYLIERESFLASLFLQIFLFIYLLRKTAWLEELTKAECWIALIVVFLVLKKFWNLETFENVRFSQFNDAFLWYILPKFWYFSLKMYMLAGLVKIPIVLVYNFASLSRKLQISSFFQSTFPQLIQLVILLIIFYFFIAGWQAEKVRRSMFEQVDSMISGEITDASLFKVKTNALRTLLHIKGYEPVHLSDFDSLPAEGVMSIPKDQSLGNPFSTGVGYFLFVNEKDKETLYFVKLDRDFLNLVAKETSILAGSQLLAYPYNPPTWESYLYQLGFKGERTFRILPFGLTRQREGPVLAAPFEPTEESSADWVQKINDRLMRRNPFTIGLVVAPLINTARQQAGFFAFDILLVPNASFFTWTLSSYILLLGFIFLLVNTLVIRRMSKFGSEINRMIVQKFNQLRSGIREISSGNLDYKVRVEGKDEFVELAERFNQMGDRLKESIAEAREKERLQHELTIARNVQLDLLPQTLPEIPGFEIAATMKTANEVGGDFYDVIPLDKKRFLLTIGDVSGKGTSAAFYMAQCISLIRYSPQFTANPREIVLRLNKYFADPMIDRQIFVTAVLGVLDVKTKTMQIVRAGHTLPILIPGKAKEKIRELQIEGLGIGLERGGELFEKHLEDGKVTLKGGDTLILYTDGVVEAARSEENESKENKYKFYSEEGLISFLAESRDKSPAELLEALKKDIESFYARNAPNDDFTLLVIQKKRR